MADVSAESLIAFKRWDVNSTGTIHIQDWCLVMEKLGLEPQSQSLSAALLRAFARGKSCHIDYERTLRWIFSETDASEWTAEGVRTSDGACLAGASPSSSSFVDRPSGIGRSDPLLVGGFEALLAKEPALDSQAYNSIKKCSQCGKPCAIVMRTCNACGASLDAISITRAGNIFIGFIFGVDKAGFPLRISLRSETPDTIVFDDPLALTSAHILAVPTDVYVPDVRSLFVAPARGLELVQRLDEAAWDVTRKEFLADDAWRQRTLAVAGLALPIDALRGHVMACFNLPPSQYQLHLQYMLLPLFPHHLQKYKQGAHYAKGRHFPLEYVVSALTALDKAGESIPDAPRMSTEDFVDAITRHGVDYDAMYAANIVKMKQSNRLLANFSESDFSYALLDGRILNKDLLEPPPKQAPDAKALDDADKLALQSYGRPYGADGKPGGTYYSYAREPALLPLLS